MSYVNTGYARNKSLTVTKGSYTHTYDIAAGFTHSGTTYQSLSNQGFAQLSQGDYERRLQDFVDYVFSLESGLSTDCPNLIQGAYEYNTALCPVLLPT